MLRLIINSCTGQECFGHAVASAMCRVVVTGRAYHLNVFSYGLAALGVALLVGITWLFDGAVTDRLIVVTALTGAL